MNILIVDDNANNRMILKLLLEDYSEDNNIEFFMDEAADGVQAVEKCDSHKFDIVLMDIMMPNMDGIEATQHIREMHPSVMIIAVSAVDDSIRQKQILSNGAEDYIFKPVNADIFTSRISNYITLINARTHERKNEFFINLFSKRIYNRNTKFMINSEDSLSEFWEFFLLNAEDKYDGLSDVVRAIFAIADTQVRISVDSKIYIEESDTNQYFTLTNIDQLPPKVVELVLRKNIPPCEYKISEDKISFELPKMLYTSDEKYVEEDKEDLVNQETPEEISMSIDLLDHKSKELMVFNYMDEDDLYDLEEFARKLESLMLIVGNGDLTREELEEVYMYMDKISTVLSTYNEVYAISNALSQLSSDISSHMDEFIQNASALGPMCKAFSSDMSSWIKKSFHTGAPSADFMNDTIVVNCQTIGSMLTMNDDAADDVNEVDDIFDF